MSLPELLGSLYLDGTCPDNPMAVLNRLCPDGTPADNINLRPLLVVLCSFHPDGTHSCNLMPLLTVCETLCPNGIRQGNIHVIPLPVLFDSLCLNGIHPGSFDI